MSDMLSENYKRIVFNINEAREKYRSPDDNIRLMAVTKTIPPETVNAAIDLGVNLLGENRVQEFLSKESLYKPAEVHFIGSLQTNKVRKIIGSVSMIHSVDSASLAEEINRISLSKNTVTDVLIELNIGGEYSKSGVSTDDFGALAGFLQTLPAVNFRGIMVIPPPGKSDYYFAKTQEFFEKQKSIYNTDTLSMGMSADYAEAIKYGANILRVGSALFGARDYSKG
jgi:pyridoxal phosphate enzyme (YggS family)